MNHITKLERDRIYKAAENLASRELNIYEIAEILTGDYEVSDDRARRAAARAICRLRSAPVKVIANGSET